MNHNTVNGKPRGYTFIEYEHERDMHSASKHADGKKIKGRRVLVDVERGRTVKEWMPLRLGGGLGGTRRGGPDVNLKHSGREDNEREREKYHLEREREATGDYRDCDIGEECVRAPDRERERERQRSRSREREREKKRRSRSRSRERKHHLSREPSIVDPDIEEIEEKPRDRDHDRDRDHKRKRRCSRSHDRDRKRERRGRDREDREINHEKRERDPDREEKVHIKQEPMDVYEDNIIMASYDEINDINMLGSSADKPPDQILGKVTIHKAGQKSNSGSYSSKGEKKDHGGTVVCGVCGAVRYYSFVKQARKFGIYSCKSCHKFISKMIHSKGGGKLKCNEDKGECTMPPYVVNPLDSVRLSHLKGCNARCPACWLKLCLRAFSMPGDLCAWLGTRLPDYMQDPAFLSSTISSPANPVLKRLLNEDSEFPSDLQDESRQNLSDELHSACQTKQYIPHRLIGLMYQLDLTVLCSLRKFTHERKYPSLLFAFEDSEIDKFNNIVLRYKKKSIHIQIENVDKYYINNGISYARLFTKEKRSFSMYNYFDSFVKHLISKSGSLSNNTEYLIVYTNSGLDLTEEKNLKEGKFKNFYPFKFDNINTEKCDLLKDFLFTNDDLLGSGFYQFSRNKTTREELLKRLEFSSAMQKLIKERQFSQEFEKEIKEAFLDKLVFAVNQPNREELNSIIKNEIERNSTVGEDYRALQEKILCDLTTPPRDKKFENYVSGIIYEFNLLILFLHDMFLHKNIFSISSEGKGNDISNSIALHHKDKITYVKAYNTNSNIGYNQLFPSRQQKEKNISSINKYFTLFVEELRENIEYFIIYTNADLDFTEEKKLKKGRSTDFYPLKFDKVKVLRDCLCINGNGLYRFAQEEATRKKLLSLLKLPPSLQKEKAEGRLSNESEQEIKEKFVEKLIFATNQPNREELNNIIKDEIAKSDVPYNYEELQEIALRWSESHEFGHITGVIIKKLFEDIKNNRSSYKKIQNKNINTEIKFARSVVGREGTPAFNQFLNFLIKGEGIKCLEVLKREGIDLASMSSILHVTGANAAKAFKDLYELWFDKQGNKTKYLNTLEKEEINLSNMSSILGGSGTNAAKAFKDLYELWFDMEGSKTQYLNTLEKEGINLTNMSSILSGAGANTPKAFKDLYELWFDGEGSKTQYLNTLEKEGINLTNMTSILNVAGANAAKAFKDLYELWFDVKGSKTQYLNTLEKEGINLTNMSSILSGAGANTAKAFKDLYELWFDGEGSKTQYLNTLEKEGINLTNMSSILSGAGANAAKAFKDLYDFWFDAKGNKKQHLKHFIEDKDRKKSFTLHNLSGILSRAGANAKGAFERLHSVCFSDKGKRSELLDDFYKAGFRPSNLSCTLCGAGVRASIILKRLHGTCFNEKREKTKFLDDFYKVGFRPCDLCGVLSAAADSLKRFHGFCFTKETKKYLNHFLIEKEGFTPNNLSKILHGAGANICSALEDFHNVCFDETGNKTQLLDDFYKAGFRSSDLSNILNMAGNNATSILRNLHKLCFNKKHNLNHFLAEKKLFTPKDLSKILYGVGINICSIFEKLHNLCFNKAGNKTDYLNNLIKSNSPNEIFNILYEKVRKSSPIFLDDISLQQQIISKRTAAKVR